MSKNLKQNKVHIYGLNAQNVELDILLDVPQFVAYMSSLTVEDFNDFTELKISYKKETMLQNTYKEKTFSQLV